ncbi:MAG: hypothetical protein LUG51_06140, partial [Tannerellaceae bacterium]|nr:hypothetical protein [Tannerellaceae bacterium]
SPFANHPSKKSSEHDWVAPGVTATRSFGTLDKVQSCERVVARRILSAPGATRGYLHCTPFGVLIIRNFIKER